jgi:protein-S-isoprenylcysteine O-methyltransferase Ste14
MAVSTPGAALDCHRFPRDAVAASRAKRQRVRRPLSLCGCSPRLGSFSIVVWFALLVVAAAADFAWVASRARREWSRSDDLSPMTAVAISSLYVLALALTIVALVLRPWPIDLSLAVAIPAGGALAIVGLALVVIGARPFGSSARLYGVDAGDLIEGGIYSVSRNPQYTGLILAVCGVGIVGRSMLALAVAAFVAVALWVWVIAVEEPHLARTFGGRYRSYRARTPRFLGRPRAG